MAPMLNNFLGDPAGAAVDSALEGAGEFMDNVSNEVSDSVRQMEEGCLPPVCGW